MAIVARANKRITWKQFYLNKGDRILLDYVHMHGEVFLPGSGMVNIPFWEWIRQGRLDEYGKYPLDMGTYEYSMMDMGMEEEFLNLEPMFHHMVFSKAHMGLIGAEVGVHLGENAEKILRCLPMAKLYLIDSYELNPDYQHGNPDLEAARHSARKRLEPYGGRVCWLYGTSEDILPTLSNLDFVYHDSDHRRPNVERELPLGYAAVKPGGWWGGHDYKQTLEGECEVKSCVDEYFIDNKLPSLYYSATQLNWWTIKE